MNIHNLKRMYNHILTVPEELLDMQYWRKEGAQMTHYECNTIGCIIGHCIILDTSIVKRKSDNAIDFERWSEDFLKTRSSSDAWDFLFSQKWAEGITRNSKSQILARLKQFIIESNLALGFWWEQDYYYLVTNPTYLDQTPFELW
jgi:hypothetical protein